MIGLAPKPLPPLPAVAMGVDSATGEEVQAAATAAPSRLPVVVVVSGSKNPIT
jgi:hypothetical protein